MKNETKFRKIAGRIYDELTEELDGFDFEEFEAALRAELEAHSADDELLDDFAHSLAQSIDKQRSGGQKETLFDPEGLECIERLGGGRRVKRRFMRRTDVFTMLSLAGENAAAIAMAFAKKQREANDLLPYFVDEQVTYEDALNAWIRDNPS